MTRMVYVRTFEVAPTEALEGMNPEKKAVVMLGMTFWIGVHGLSKVDWTTEWFCADVRAGYWRIMVNIPWGGTGTAPGRQLPPLHFPARKSTIRLLLRLG